MKTTLITIILGLFGICAAQNCGGITLQDCGRSYCDELVIDNVASKEDCQNTCIGAATWFHCDSFFYNAVSKVCTNIHINTTYLYSQQASVTNWWVKNLFFSAQKCSIYDCPVQEWEATCKIIGAPKGVDVSECLGSKVGCDLFRIGQCENGTPFGEITVSSIKSCKVCSTFNFK